MLDQEQEKTISERVEIVNIRGLHARSAAVLARRASQFDARISVRHGTCVADADSIMDLLMLVAGRGAVIEICAHGRQAEAAVASLVALVEDRFGEST